MPATIKSNPLINDCLLKEKLEKKREYMAQKQKIEKQKSLGLSNSSMSQRILRTKCNKPVSIQKSFNYSMEKTSKFQRSISSETRRVVNRSANLSSSGSTANSLQASMKKLNVTSLKRNSLNLNHAGHQQPSSMSSRRREHPLFRINLEIAVGVSELVTFYPHNQIDTIAYELSVKHNLKNEKFIILKKILQDNYDKYISDHRSKNGT